MKRTYTPIPAPNTDENRVHGRVTDTGTISKNTSAGKVGILLSTSSVDALLDLWFTILLTLLGKELVRGRY